MSSFDPQAWSIDPGHSTVEFGVRHLMIATVKGRFSDVSGIVQFDPRRPTDGRVDVTIQAASVDTGNADRDADLRSPNFYDVEQYPMITYRSRRVEPRADGTYHVIGDLTIRGIGREVPLSVTPGGAVRDPWGNERAAYTASAKINRSDFGMSFNQVLETGGVLIGDEVRINLEVELVRQAAAAAA